MSKIFRNPTRIILLMILMSTIALGAGLLQTRSESKQSVQQEEEGVIEKIEPSHLVILWTSADRDVALKMVFMYALNSKKYEWWKDITFIVWGPSAKLLSEDIELQDQLKVMDKAGIELKACKACADQYGVAAKLEELGIEVIYIGKELTDYIKGDYEVLTF